MKPLFRTILCADWSKETAGRAVARADLNGPALIVEPQPAGGWSVAGVLGRARDLSVGGPVLVGFDAPIGVPRSFLRVANQGADPASSLAFVQWLRSAAASPGFWQETSDPDAWSVHRPFFTIAAGAGSRTRWEARLRALDIDPLREIDRRTRANPAFVVSGIPGSVGSAARDLWQGLLKALSEKPPRVALWPFGGTLAELATKGSVVIGEIYPRMAYAVALSEREYADRPAEDLHKNLKAVREDALARLVRVSWVQRHNVAIDEAHLRVARESGDPFDALMSGAALLRCLLDDEPLGSSGDGLAEGGILGSGAVVLSRRAKLRKVAQPAAAGVDRSIGIRCPVPGCPQWFRQGRLGWDAHVGSSRRHPNWHPELTDPEARKARFREEYPEFFR